MLNIETSVSDYLNCCRYQKNLNSKTLKAYQIDLKQFSKYMLTTDMQPSRFNISNFIIHLNKNYAPKSAKRKIASVKAFFTYLEYEELIPENPFSRMRMKFHEPFLLPRTISLESLRKVFMAAYENERLADSSEYQKKTAVRDIAVLELLFATGLRVSELCSIKQKELDLEQGVIRIYGKGAKERLIQITNRVVLTALGNYRNCFSSQMQDNEFFFLNRFGLRLSEQSVRFMIKRFASMADLPEHITPHMFRHTFATMLLEEDVDIRYIQQILGHSSIITTQIYTHVAANKQKEILTMKHPRNRIDF